MASPYNGAILINKNTMGDACDVPVLRNSRLSFPIVFHWCPSFSLDVVLYFFVFLIYTYSNDTYISPIPLRLMFFNHLLVMGHRTLTGWAPCCPEVNKENLSDLMLQRDQAFITDTSQVCNIWHLVFCNFVRCFWRRFLLLWCLSLRFLLSWCLSFGFQLHRCLSFIFLFFGSWITSNLCIILLSLLCSHFLFFLLLFQHRSLAFGILHLGLEGIQLVFKFKHLVF